MSIELAREVLTVESEGLLAVRDRLGEEFVRAVDVIMACPSRLVVTGIGKSGLVGQKIVATLNSTGTPSFFLHPVEAMHGDLGMVAPTDVILAISYSGETSELNRLLGSLRERGVPIIALCGVAESTLARQALVTLDVAIPREACPLGLAPTTSTTMQLAMGDCLAVALLEAKRFSASDFKVFHPGGSLGANLRYVGDVMHKGDRLPLARESEPMQSALVTMTAKSFGCLGIVNAGGDLIGVITDGDLRRHMGEKLLAQSTDDVMTRNPKTIAPTMLASAALEMLNSRRITALFVVDGGKPVGIVHVHDLLRLGVA